jgi:dTDP-glucose 4,6-dehydratase
MRLIVTGGAGFLGSHFVRRWEAARPDDTVVVIDALTYAGDLDKLGDSPCQFVHGDIADPPAVRAAFDAAAGGVDALVHFAAETHVDRSLQDAPTFVRTNVLGTQVLLDVARERGVGRFVHISTDEVYCSVDAAVDETAPFRPGSPYAASKVGAEALVMAARNTWGLPVVVARPANAFGPRQYPEKLVPVLLRAALNGAPLPLYGDGLHVRDWVAAEELAEAITILVERGAVGEAYNLPGSGGRTNRSVAEAVCAAAGVSPALIDSVRDRPGHDRRYAMRGDKVAALGWTARRRLEDALPDLIAEYWRLRRL